MQEMLEFYAALNFEEIEVEDNLTSFFSETDDAGSYVLLTDEEGALPTSLKQKVILAYYTPEGSFQWSVSFKNSHLFQKIWTKDATLDKKLAAALAHREENDIIQQS